MKKIKELISKDKPLLPCPFCGGEALLQKVQISYEPTPRYRILCSGCGLTRGWEWNSEEEAIGYWNTRAEV